MIHIKKPADCCGCSACASICPHQAINMTPLNMEGKGSFIYPVVDKNKCVDCGLCDRVCPICDTSSTPTIPLKSYAFRHNDHSIAQNCATAGAFACLAEKTLMLGGTVFGVAFDADWNAKHFAARSRQEVSKLFGSKYLQSDIGKTFIDCKQELQSGKQVLFSGTPCQIAGLKKFLRKDYSNLICVDLICHGVPSSKVWNQYLAYRLKQEEKQCGESLHISHINFRDKTNGWQLYSLALTFSDKNGNAHTPPPQTWKNDLYMQSFLNHLNVRPACLKCHFRNQKSGSDITIGDYWKFSHFYPNKPNDDNGINAVIINSQKGQHFFHGINFAGFETPYQNIVFGNPQLIKSGYPHINLKKFVKAIDSNADFEKCLLQCEKTSLTLRIIDKLKKYFSKYFQQQ